MALIGFPDNHSTAPSVIQMAGAERACLPVLVNGPGNSAHRGGHGGAIFAWLARGAAQRGAR